MLCSSQASPPLCYEPLCIITHPRRPQGDIDIKYVSMSLNRPYIDEIMGRCDRVDTLCVFGGLSLR